MTERFGLFLCLLGMLSAGCGQVRETLPARSAMEQLLLSTAADRALKHLPVSRFAGKRVFLDTSRLEAYDKGYVVLAVRKSLLEAGAALAPDASQADVVLEMASGALSVNRRHYLLGLPELPLPVPFAGESLKTPEIPLFKALIYRGRARLAFAARDPRTQRGAGVLPACDGTATASYWWILLTGPYDYSDIPKGPGALEEAKKILPGRRTAAE